MTTNTIPTRGNFARALRDAFDNAGIPRRRLADTLGYSPQTAYRRLNGKARIYLTDIVATSQLTGRDAGDLLHDAYAKATA